MQIKTLEAVLGVQLQHVQLLVSFKAWYMAELDWTYIHVCFKTYIIWHRKGSVLSIQCFHGDIKHGWVKGWSRL